MPTVVTERPYRDVPLEAPRKKWTRSECSALEAAGVWDQQHLELVEGELITKMGKKRPHVISLSLVQAWLWRVFGDQYVNPNVPIDVAPEDNPTNEPEPDLVVLARRSWEYPSDNLRPDDLRLVVEISDSTLGFDLTVKAGLYARAGIVEYWVFDVAARRLVVHRDPQRGLYQSIAVYNESESVSPLASPGSDFRVGEAFPG